MKHIRLKILTVIWVVILLLFSLFEIMINTALPLYFEGQAEDALEYEVEYIKGLRNDMENSDDYVGTYFSGEINYIEFYDDSEDEDEELENTGGYKESIQLAESDILAFKEKNPLENRQCYSFSTENGYYVVARYDDVSFEGQTVETLMYINIQPVVRYTRSLNIILAAFFICISAVMTVIGLNLGKRIVQAQETQQKFFQNSSHELRTPLMSIQGYAEAIENGIVDCASSAEIILQESERMSKLVDEILEISKIDAHQLSLHFGVADVRELLYDCLNSLEPILEKDKIELTPDFSLQPVYISCDEERLSGAFANVLLNALRHCKKSVFVTCKESSKHCIVTVCDDGGGISQEDLPHIFDRFYSGRDGNTGIGLALTSEIVRLHGGTIRAQNLENGACFEILLPLNTSRFKS